MYYNPIPNGLEGNAVSSWGNDALPGAQVDMIIERADNTINLCEAKFTKENFVITKNYATQLKLRKTIFRPVHPNKKSNLFYAAYNLPRH